jgi:small subunit ribosomal protein S17
MTERAGKVRGRRQVLTGTVVRDKMDKTVVVAVERTVMHRLYRRYVKRTSKFAAHDEGNECRLGDRVVIVASRPLSKRKRWRVREIVERAR